MTLFILVPDRQVYACNSVQQWIKMAWLKASQSG